MGAKASTNCCYANAFGKGTHFAKLGRISQPAPLIAQIFLRARDVVISGRSTAIAGVKRAPVAPRHSYQGTIWARGMRMGTKIAARPSVFFLFNIGFI
jgi:hypothetical protein